MLNAFHLCSLPSSHLLAFFNFSPWLLFYPLPLSLVLSPISFATSFQLGWKDVPHLWALAIPHNALKSEQSTPVIPVPFAPVTTWNCLVYFSDHLSPLECKFLWSKTLPILSVALLTVLRRVSAHSRCSTSICFIEWIYRWRDGSIHRHINGRVFNKTKPD